MGRWVWGSVGAGVPLVDGVLRLVQLAAQFGSGFIGVDGPVCLGLLLPHPFQFGKHRVRGRAGIPQDAFGLSLAPAAGIFLGPLHLFPEFPCFPGVLLPLAVQPVSLLLSLFQRLPLGL